MISTPMSESRAIVLTPLATVLSASMSRPESVSSSTASRGCWSAIWRISMRFFSPPEKPSLMYRLENSLGTFVSSIAASTVRRNSFSGIAGSPRASRWALMTMRRYFVVVTPGIATGYWKAMNSPATARASGSASVMSSPSKRIWPSVTSRLGWPMIALASVDLPEPLGPMSAWNSPERTCRSTPRRMFLSPALTCRLRISRSAMVSLGQRKRSVGLGELDELGQGGALQGADDPHLHARPHQLGGAVALVRAVGARDARALLPLDEALHRRDRALEREHHRVHRDLLRRAAEDVAPVRAARGGHEARLLEQRGDALEVGERQVLRRRDGLERHGPRPAEKAQLDEQPDPVFRLRREDHRGANPTTGVGVPSDPGG